MTRLPGITVDGLLEYSRYRSDDAGGPDNHGLGVGPGTAIRRIGTPI